MAGENHVSGREFVLLREHIDSKFDETHGRMDRFESEIRPAMLDHAAKLAVLEFQANQAHRQATAAAAQVASSKRKTSQRASLWGGSAAGVILFLIEFVKVVKGYWTGH